MRRTRSIRLSSALVLSHRDTEVRHVAVTIHSGFHLRTTVIWRAVEKPAPRECTTAYFSHVARMLALSIVRHAKLWRADGLVRYGHVLHLCCIKYRRWINYCERNDIPGHFLRTAGRVSAPNKAGNLLGFLKTECSIAILDIRTHFRTGQTRLRVNTGANVCLILFAFNDFYSAQSKYKQLLDNRKVSAPHIHINWYQ